jgi:hypothetical protein
MFLLLKAKTAPFESNLSDNRHQEIRKRPAVPGFPVFIFRLSRAAGEKSKAAPVENQKGCGTPST